MEKRFTIFQDSYDVIYIKDKEVFRANGLKIGNEENVKFEHVLKVGDCLNALHEENQSLKQSFDLINKVRKELIEENEQLKQYIYDNIDENICDVCSYQYLEKHSQMQGYYVAKCKKGYDNCSKGTVIHCKDFKFKELNVND